MSKAGGKGVGKQKLTHVEQLKLDEKIVEAVKKRSILWKENHPLKICSTALVGRKWDEAAAEAGMDSMYKLENIILNSH